MRVGILYNALEADIYSSLVIKSWKQVRPPTLSRHFQNENSTKGSSIISVCRSMSETLPKGQAE